MAKADQTPLYENLILWRYFAIFQIQVGSAYICTVAPSHVKVSFYTPKTVGACSRTGLGENLTFKIFSGSIFEGLWLIRNAFIFI